MIVIIITLHVIACILLMIIVLIQQGRGGGLVEGFSGVESMFGPKTSVFLTRATSVLSVTFFLTCLSLAFLASRQSRSLMKDVSTQPTNVNVSGTSTPGTQKPTEPLPSSTTPVTTNPVTSPTETPKPVTSEAPAPTKEVPPTK